RPKNELETESAIDEKLIVEIDKIIHTAKKVIAEHADLFSQNRLKEINQLTKTLERVRTSNNIKHIAEVSEQLFHAMDRPDHAENKNVDEYQKTIGKARESQILNQEMDPYKKAVRFQKIKEFLKGIKKKLASLSRKLSRAKPLKSDAKEPQTAEEMTKETGPLEPNAKTLWHTLKKYLTAPDELTKKISKRELKTLWQKWHPFRKAKKTEAIIKPEKTANQGPQEPSERPKKHDFTNFFLEVDSFTGWLLFFYITYFFLVSFAIEKNMGLPSVFVLKTLSSPLLLNITAFLLITHFLLRIKIQAFRQNIIGSLFLFFLGYGLFTLLIFNF
ncbi:MAG: hypothetical protein V1760_02275, partial [Candidatus Peregrinibacteria bacterium]